MKDPISMDAPTHSTVDRHARRLAELEVRLNDLERSRRRLMVLGPMFLLALANVTPLVGADHRDGTVESFTLFRLVFGSVDAVPPGWFLLVAVVGLACAVSATLVGAPNIAGGTRWFVIGSAGALAALLGVFVVVVAAAGSRSVSYTGLTPAAFLGAGAAIWLILGARERA